MQPGVAESRCGTGERRHDGGGQLPCAVNVRRESEVGVFGADDAMHDEERDEPRSGGEQGEELGRRERVAVVGGCAGWRSVQSGESRRRSALPDDPGLVLRAGDPGADQCGEFCDHGEQARFGSDRTAEPVGDHRAEGQSRCAFSAQVGWVRGDLELVVDVAVVGVRTQQRDQSPAGQDDERDVPPRVPGRPDHVLGGGHGGVDEGGDATGYRPPTDSHDRGPPPAGPRRGAATRHHDSGPQVEDVGRWSKSAP